MSTGQEPEAYACERLRSALAVDERVSELGVEVHIVTGKVLLTGQVPTLERRHAVGEIAAELMAGYEVHNELTVTSATEAPRVEHLAPTRGSTGLGSEMEGAQ